MTLSPGSIKLTKQNSIPALPVPLTGKVISFRVKNTCRNIPLISSINFTKTGSRWPTSGRDIACKTEGATSLGPGPIKWRTGGSKFLGISIVPDGVRIPPARQQFILKGAHLRIIHSAHDLICELLPARVGIGWQ